MGEGVAVKDAWVRIIKGSFQKHLKKGWVKAKVVRRGRGFESVATPTPQKILIIHKEGLEVE